MTLHAPFFYLFGSEKPPNPRTAGSKQDIKMALFCLESMSQNEAASISEY